MTDLSKYDEIIIWGASFPPGNNPRGGGALPRTDGPLKACVTC